MMDHQGHPARQMVAWLALLLAFSGAVCGLSTTAAAQQGPPLVPPSFTPEEAVVRAVDAQWLTDAERREMRIFHGLWTDEDLQSVTLQALAALARWDLDHPSLKDEQVPAEIRAEALLHQGELEQCLQLLDGVDSLRAWRIRAEAHEMNGAYDRADAALEAPVRELVRARQEDPADLVEGVRSLAIRARLRGQPARDYQTMMNLLGRARLELDRLYWPARLLEAELLLDKDNTGEAVRAIHEAMRLNPRSSEGWYVLGQIALRQFDFAGVERAAQALTQLNPVHPLAVMLRAESALTQDDPDRALDLLTPLVQRWPGMRRPHALVAAVRAVQYDDDAMLAALARCDELSPGSARPYYLVGRYLSFNRQYEAAADLLNEAVKRQPNWPAPQIELGLMELQSGRDALALAALRSVAELDPFNKRAANSLFLLEELANYDTIETDHFIVRYRPGIDEVMVNMMPPVLDEIHAAVTGRFEHVPDRKTVLELMPDHERFSVRIVGMPWIHTIAAATGPVIAMEVPREGPPQKHLGLFDWPRVLRHEYAHTVTLSQTRNRIPHWLTEAAAVSVEFAPRDMNTIRLLVEAYHSDMLFDLDEINWAFVRPRRATDRAQAYAQGHWMVEFMNERFGYSALIRLMERYFDGERDSTAFPNALNVSRDDFYHEFLIWAAEEVRRWGFDASPSMLELTDQLRAQDEAMIEMLETSKLARLDAIARALTDRAGQPAGEETEPITADRWPPMRRPAVTITDEHIDAWLDEHPDHPDLVEMKLRRAIDAQGSVSEDLIPLVEHYMTLRPVDPYPHRLLATYWLDSDHPERAIPHLEELDAREQKTPVYAVQLSTLYRDAGDLERALAKMTRALHINPYSAAYREPAAALSIQAGRLDMARMHIHALTLLEPDRPQHLRRLEAIDAMIARQQLN